MQKNEQTEKQELRIGMLSSITHTIRLAVAYLMHTKIEFKKKDSKGNRFHIEIYNECASRYECL